MQIFHASSLNIFGLSLIIQIFQTVVKNMKIFYSKYIPLEVSLYASTSIWKEHEYHIFKKTKLNILFILRYYYLLFRYCYVNLSHSRNYYQRNAVQTVLLNFSKNLQLLLPSSSLPRKQRLTFNFYNVVNKHRKKYIVFALTTRRGKTAL